MWVGRAIGGLPAQHGPGRSPDSTLPSFPSASPCALWQAPTTHLINRTSLLGETLHWLCSGSAPSHLIPCLKQQPELEIWKPQMSVKGVGRGF